MLEPWTRKTCAWAGCGRAPIDLHHPVYEGIPSGTVALHLVPLCRHHHKDFEFNLWPRMRSTMTRQAATLAGVVHGEYLHYVIDEVPIGGAVKVAVAHSQLQLPIRGA